MKSISLNSHVAHESHSPLPLQTAGIKKRVATLVSGLILAGGLYGSVPETEPEKSHDMTQKLAEDLRAIGLISKEIDVSQFSDAIKNPQTPEDVRQLDILKEAMIKFIIICTDDHMDEYALSEKLISMVKNNQNYRICLYSNEPKERQEKPSKPSKPYWNDKDTRYLYT